MKLIDRNEYYDKFMNFIVFIKVDENCNLDCSFCYQGKKNQKRIDTEEKLQNCFLNLDFGIDRFLDIKKQERYEHATLTICFFGGEATLNPWAISKICDHLKEKYSKEERNSFFLTLTSNGLIFDETIKNIFREMKTVSDIPVSILISTDNDKEVYDKNRKYKDGKESGFEIVQKHIKEYQAFLRELNDIPNGDFVKTSTVLATTEQLKNIPELINSSFKDINRRGKLLYELPNQEHDYVEEAKKFLLKSYGYLINKLSKEDKQNTLNVVIEAIWQMKGKGEFHECTHLYAIDGDGNTNWCNKVKGFEGKDEITQEELRDLAIFNYKTDNSHFRCYKLKMEGGDLCKNVIRPQLWEQTVAIFDPTIPFNVLEISDEFDIYKNEKHLYDFVKYMVGSTKGKKAIITNLILTDKIKHLCKELEIELMQENKFTSKNIFYIDKLGNVFFDKMLSDNKDLILTNVLEKHFMWIHTPTMLNSINEYFRTRLNKLP